MHGEDFHLLSSEELPDGTRRLEVRIAAAELTRIYLYNPAEDGVQLASGEEPLLVGGHDMTSIIGKRVREWLRSEVLGKHGDI